MYYGRNEKIKFTYYQIRKDLLDLIKYNCIDYYIKERI